MIHWKLVLMPRGACELYDLARDPGETNNLAATQPDRASEMSRQWQQWKAQLPPTPPRTEPQAGSKPNGLLIVSWPRRFQAGVTCDSLAELVDLYPTLADLLKLQRPSQAPALAGRSLVPTLAEGKPTGRSYAFSENYSQATVIGEHHKLGVWQDPGPVHQAWDWRGQPPGQLYARDTDPQELHNLAGTPAVASIERALREALAAWQRQFPAGNPALAR